MKAEDVTDTLKLALQASGLDQATVMHRPRLLSDNGSSYVSGDPAYRVGINHLPSRSPCSSLSTKADQGPVA
jgi:transposase InsO family protein